MLKVILNAPHLITPFNEPARDLRIQNTPLWLHQRNVLTPYTTREVELKPGQRFPQQRDEMIVYRDNLYFDEEYINTFITLARRKKSACRAAFSADDLAFKEHALPLSSSYTPAGQLFLADLWYYPNGPMADVESLVIDLGATELGYYHVPTYMADQSGDLTFQAPLRALIAIDSWVHIFIADMVFGLFSRGARFEKRLNEDLGFKLKILAKALYEGTQVLECSELVRVGITHGHIGPAQITTPERARLAFARQPDLAAICFGHSHIPSVTRMAGGAAAICAAGSGVDAT